MPSSLELFKKYVSEYFVETGSYVGNGIQFAIDAGFKNIYSIELSDKYIEHCQKRFLDNKVVKIFKGDSGIVLYDIIKDIENRITFWLDGHHSCGDTALGCAWTPLMHELDLIARHPRKDHIIMIDDMICWEKENPVIGFGINEIQKKILEINPKYTFEYQSGHWGETYCDKYVLIAIIKES